MKIRQSNGSPFPCGRADMTKLAVAFRNFGNASKKRFFKNSISPCGLVRHDKLKNGDEFSGFLNAGVLCSASELTFVFSAM
jgi:hypothetical protein